MNRVLAALMVVPLLLGNDGGCENESVRLIIPEIPESMQRCLPDPLKGKNIKEIRTQVKKLNDAQIAIILANYKSAHADCEAKVNEIRELYQGWKVRVR